MESGQLKVEILGRGFTWLDTGTHESLFEATNFVKSIEYHQGFKIACLEEIAFFNKWIGVDELKQSIKRYKETQYSEYLTTLIPDDYYD